MIDTVKCFPVHKTYNFMNKIRKLITIRFIVKALGIKIITSIKSQLLILARLIDWPTEEYIILLLKEKR